MQQERPIRVLVTKLGLDGHDRGAKVIAAALRDAGMEVVYTGLRQTPAMVVRAALEEDVDVIGVSTLSGAHRTLIPKLRAAMDEADLDDVVLIVGGIIPETDLPTLEAAGVRKVFTPGTPLGEIVSYIQSSVAERRTSEASST